MTEVLAAPHFCAEPHIPCNGTNLTCHNGLCCMNQLNSSQANAHCLCEEGFIGLECKEKEIDFSQYDFVREQVSTMQASSIVSLLIAGLAFIALAAVIVILVRKSKEKAQRRLEREKSSRQQQEVQQKTMQSLTRTISVLTEDVEKLPKLDNLTNLNRISKLIENSVLTGTPLTVPNAANRWTGSRRASRACLPRWSSVPEDLVGLVPPVDDVDAADCLVSLPVEKKRKLQHMFSYQGAAATKVLSFQDTPPTENTLCSPV